MSGSGSQTPWWNVANICLLASRFRYAESYNFKMWLVVYLHADNCRRHEDADKQPSINHVSAIKRAGRNSTLSENGEFSW